MAEGVPAADGPAADGPATFETAVLGPTLGRGGWATRLARAGRFSVAAFDSGVVALAGFLIRGGLLALAIPSVILPSLIGLASVFNVNAIGIDGHPTSWLVAVIAWSVLAVAAWLLVAGVVGSVVDVWLIRATVAEDARVVARPQAAPSATLLLDMAAIRLLCLLPIGAVVALVAQPLYQAGYDELTLPTNLADPLPLRVAARAALPLAAILVTWLLTEMVAAIVIRRLVLGAGFRSAWSGTAGQLLRRPLTSVATQVVTMGGSIVAVGAAALATGLSFNLCLAAARYATTATPASTSGFDPGGLLRASVFLGAALLLVLAWLVALAIAGVTSAWRSAAWTEETAAAWLARGRGRVVGAAAFPWPTPPAAGDAGGSASPDPAQPRQTADS